MLVTGGEIGGEGQRINLDQLETLSFGWTIEREAEVNGRW